MTYAISYVRFSHPNQRLGDSLRRQIAEAAAYAAKHGLQLDETIRDEGQSAYTGNHVSRGALGRLLARVQQGDIPQNAVLIVEAIDRLSRQDVVSAMEQFIQLLRAGIVIVTLIDGQRYDAETVRQNPSLLQLSLNLMALANRESANKSHRLLKTWEKKRQLAASENRPPTRSCPGWLTVASSRQKDGTFYTVDSQKAAAVRSIFEMAAAGRGLNDIARELNDRGIPLLSKRKKSGAAWCQSTVRYLAYNDAVLGTYVPHSGTGGKNRTKAADAIPSHYPSIVDRSLVDRARAGIADRRMRGRGRQGRGVPNLLAGVAKCGACFGSMNFVRGGGRGRPDYLICYNGHRHGPCLARERFHYGRLERTIITNLGRLALSGGGQADRIPELEARIARANAEADRERRAAERIGREWAYAEGVTTPAVLQRLLTEAEQKEARLRIEIGQLTSELTRARAKTTQSRRAGNLADLISLALDDGPETTDRASARKQIRAALRTVVSEIVCGPVTKNTWVFVGDGSSVWEIDEAGVMQTHSIYGDGQSLIIDLQTGWHGVGRHLSGREYAPEAVRRFWKRLVAGLSEADAAHRLREAATAANLLIKRHLDEYGVAPPQPFAPP
jgi:DNA invertase Pin-like site-specific DNA recombinase